MARNLMKRTLFSAVACLALLAGGFFLADHGHAVGSYFGEIILADTSVPPHTAKIDASGNVAVSLAGATPDACQANTPVSTNINISTAADTLLVAGASSKKTYICGMFLFASGAENVALVEGTGTTCGTSTAGVMGGSTAATGFQLVANQGWILPPAGFFHKATATNADDLCLRTSAAVQVSGYIKTVQQ
jgi:hypothetical protein